MESYIIGTHTTSSYIYDTIYCRGQILDNKELEDFTYLENIVIKEGVTDTDAKLRVNKDRVINNILGKVQSANNISRSKNLQLKRKICGLERKKLIITKTMFSRLQSFINYFPEESYEYQMV